MGNILLKGKKIKKRKKSKKAKKSKKKVKAKAKSTNPYHNIKLFMSYPFTTEFE